MSMSNYPPPNSGRWTTGICGCFEDWGTCCLACWCPCVVSGRYIEILDEGATSCAVAGAVYYLLQVMTGCSFLYTCGYRTILRQKFGLPESPCNDFCTEFCCQACSMCQVTRELKNRNIDPALGYIGVKHIYDQPPQAQTSVPGQQKMNNVYDQPPQAQPSAPGQEYMYMSK